MWQDSSHLKTCYNCCCLFYIFFCSAYSKVEHFSLLVFQILPSPTFTFPFKQTNESAVQIDAINTSSNSNLLRPSSDPPYTITTPISDSGDSRHYLQLCRLARCRTSLVKGTWCPVRICPDVVRTVQSSSAIADAFDCVAVPGN